MLIKNAAIGSGVIVDVRVGPQGLITQLGRSLPYGTKERVIDAASNALIPGLHDHHMHLMALAAARQSVDCGTPNITSIEALKGVLKNAVSEGARELRGIGYYEYDELLIDRDWLDSISATIPIRIQHRTGRLWILNSPALGSLSRGNTPEGAERDHNGRLTGRFYHLDDWLRAHSPHSPPSLTSVSKLLASYGVTGITDTGPENDDSVLELFIAAQRGKELRQNVLLMGSESLSVYTSDTLATGHCKLYLKESDLPELDLFITKIQSIHQKNRPVAIHCVTGVEIQFALTAFSEAGVMSGDRIEHASIADDGVIAQIAGLKITVVTQPHFIAERGDQYRLYVEKPDQKFLYRGNGFLAQGVALAGGTDAPYGSADPWVAMRAAVARKTAQGVLMMPEETLSPSQSLALFTGHCLSPGGAARKIEVGAPADLCLLTVAWEDMLQTLDSRCVWATFSQGEVIYDSLGL